MNKMFAPLTADEIASVSVQPKPVTKSPIIPVPTDAPPMQFKHPKHGEPSFVWPYHDGDARLVGYVLRWNYINEHGKPDKDILPLTYCDLGNGKRGWRSKGIPSPRPLFGLPDILANPDAAVLVCEGEKARDAAAGLFSDVVSTTPAHGAESPRKTDWTAVSGRKVLIWPDNDKAGAKYAAMVAELAHEAGAASVATVDIPGDWPSGWDLADELPPGITASDLRQMLTEAKTVPTSVNDDAAREWPFRTGQAGVEKRIEHTDKDSGETTTTWRWFCSSLEIAAETRSSEGEEWGRLLRITDRDSRVKEWAMPMSMLAGDGTAYRERLLSLGLIMAPGKFARDALHEYISTARPNTKARCVSRVGWHSRAFTLSTQTVESKNE